MKKHIITLIAVVSTAILSTTLTAQCIPDSLNCPDPEGNGQVCPDTLPDALTGQIYHEAFTIIAPNQIDTLGLTFDVHHMQLMEIENMPEGFQWASNAPEDEFYPGRYYCVLMEGYPPVKGVYQLRIYIDIYAVVLDEVIKVASIIDSTSLAINVEWDPNSLPETSLSQFDITNIYPNPVGGDITMEFQAPGDGVYVIEIFSLLGELVFTELFETTMGSNTRKLNLDDLARGSYLVSLSYEGISKFHRIVKTK